MVPQTETNIFLQALWGPKPQGKDFDMDRPTKERSHSQLHEQERRAQAIEVDHGPRLPAAGNERRLLRDGLGRPQDQLRPL